MAQVPMLVRMTPLVAAPVPPHSTWGAGYSLRRARIRRREAVSGQQSVARLRRVGGNKLNRAAGKGVVLAGFLQHAVAVDRETGGGVGDRGEGERGVRAVHEAGGGVAVHKGWLQTAARSR